MDFWKGKRMKFFCLSSPFIFFHLEFSRSQHHTEHAQVLMVDSMWFHFCPRVLIVIGIVQLVNFGIKVQNFIKNRTMSNLEEGEHDSQITQCNKHCARGNMKMAQPMVKQGTGISRCVNIPHQEDGTSSHLSYCRNIYQQCNRWWPM